MGTVFNIQKYSLHDGQGIRTTVFLKGCPLSCLWCHNPESQKMSAEIMSFDSRCVGCGACVVACPEHTIAAAVGERGMPHLDPGKCTGCGRCATACAYGAREMVGYETTPEQVMDAVMRDRIFYDQSGGGVTFSGGEPLAQPEFLRELLVRSKQEGLRTTVDTSGFAPKDAILSVAPLVDTFLYDVKHMDDEKHRRYTGVSNEPVLDNLRHLAEAKVSATQILARFPLIPGINDDEENIRKTGEFLRDCGIFQVSVLPYHHLGFDKYRRLERVYELPDAAPPSKEDLDRVSATLSSLGLNAKIGS